MNETMPFPPAPAETASPARRTPTIYFIDDSATMREVIKIAFRRENITVITAGDAASAIAQFEQTPPDAVITDVIMPDQDGYSVCSQIKQHPQFNATPVILMSGVVNKNVADKAVSVGADELIVDRDDLEIRGPRFPHNGGPQSHIRRADDEAAYALRRQVIDRGNDFFAVRNAEFDQGEVIARRRFLRAFPLILKPRFFGLLHEKAEFDLFLRGETREDCGKQQRDANGGKFHGEDAGRTNTLGIAVLPHHEMAT